MAQTPEEKKAKQRAWYLAHADEQRAKAREWYKTYKHPNPEAQRARQRKWDRDNREEIQRRARERSADTSNWVMAVTCQLDMVAKIGG